MDALDLGGTPKPPSAGVRDAVDEVKEGALREGGTAPRIATSPLEEVGLVVGV